MRRRDVIAFAGGVAASAALSRQLAAQQLQPERTRRIGVLMTSADDGDGRARLAAFRDALRALGWVDGANVRLDVRWGGADPDRLRSQVEELLKLKPEAILATSGRVTRLLQGAAADVSIVFVGPVDPVGAGFVESIARPGRNITGFTSVETSFAGKWLEMLTEAAPRITRVALVFAPDNPAAAAYRSLLESATSLLGITLIPEPVRTAADIASVVDRHAREPGGGLILPLDLTISVHVGLLSTLVAQNRLPAISGYPAFATGGGLMSYGPDLPHIYGRAAVYFDRILKGEKPADLPVQAPTKFELIVNLRAAKALGLTVPPTLLARADEVIE